MWYFVWVLGTTIACTVSIITAMWLESKETESTNG